MNCFFCVTFQKSIENYQQLEYSFYHFLCLTKGNLVVRSEFKLVYNTGYINWKQIFFSFHFSIVDE